METSISLLERFTGCLLGHAIGDGLGAPFEGLSSEDIYGQFGRTASIVDKPPVDMLYCTDDTHMSIAVARVLCKCCAVDDDALIQEFAKIYDPKRGYGQGMRRLLEAVALGEEWRQVARTLFPGGSYGNGGAMRAAPIGLFFHGDLDRVWEQAGKSAALTHYHPLGIEGAQLFALAVALAVRGEAANHEAFFATLYHRAKEDDTNGSCAPHGNCPQWTAFHCWDPAWRRTDLLSRQSRVLRFHPIPTQPPSPERSPLAMTRTP